MSTARSTLISSQVFFLIFRETLETSIIVSVLLAFIRQNLGPEKDAYTYKKLLKQVGNLLAQSDCYRISLC